MVAIVSRCEVISSVKFKIFLLFILSLCTEGHSVCACARQNAPLLSLCKSMFSLFANDSLQNINHVRKVPGIQARRIMEDLQLDFSGNKCLCIHYVYGNSATNWLLGLWRNCLMQGNADSRIREIFACGIRIRNPANNWNVESKFHWPRIPNRVAPESSVWNSECNPRITTFFRLTNSLIIYFNIYIIIIWGNLFLLSLVVSLGLPRH